MKNTNEKDNRFADLCSDDTLTREEAAQELWDDYSNRLLILAARNLDIRVQSRVDEEDVVQSMYKSFCLRAKAGNFDLSSQDDVWGLLATMTIRKAKKASAKQRAQKRSVSAEEAINDEKRSAGSELASAEPTPEEVSVAEEEISLRLSSLPQELKQLVCWKMEGYSNAEISAPDKMNCSERTVERKLHRIRRLWT